MPSQRVKDATPRFTLPPTFLTKRNQKKISSNRPQVDENPEGDSRVPWRYDHKQLDRDRRSMN